MSREKPFLAFASTVSVPATTTSASTSITYQASWEPTDSDNTLLVTNAGSNLAFVTTGATTATATITSVPVLSGSQITLTLPAGHDKVAAITAAGSTTVDFTPGEGM